MSLRHRAATVTAAAMLSLAVSSVEGLRGMAVGSASAADLYGSEVYPPPAAGYDDRRYGYDQPPRAYRQGSPYRDRDGYVPEALPPNARDDRRGAACLPREVVRAHLEQRGWIEFQDLNLQGDVAHLKARRVNGRWFELTVDRCTARVLAAHPADGRAADADDRRYRSAPDYGDRAYGDQDGSFEPAPPAGPGYRQAPPAYRGAGPYPPQADYGYRGSPGY